MREDELSTLSSLPTLPEFCQATNLALAPKVATTPPYVVLTTSMLRSHGTRKTDTHTWSAVNAGASSSLPLDASL